MATITIEKTFFSIKNSHPLLPYYIILLLLIHIVIPAQLSSSKTIRSRRWLNWGDKDSEASEKTTTFSSTIISQQQQSQLLTIPAANPNFEAAFQGECGKNNNSNPCEHICLDLHDGTYECSCFYGYTLAVDGYSCAKLATTTTTTTSTSTSTSTTTMSSIYPSEIALAPSRPVSKNSSKSTQDYYQLDDSYYNESQKGDKQVLVVVDMNDSSLGKEHDQQISNHGNSLEEVARVYNATKTIPSIANDNRKLVEELARGKSAGGKEIVATRRALTYDNGYNHASNKQQQRTFMKNARFGPKDPRYRSVKGILKRKEETSGDKKLLPIDESATTNLILMQSDQTPDSNNNNNNNNNNQKEANLKALASYDVERNMNASSSASLELEKFNLEKLEKGYNNKTTNTTTYGNGKECNELTNLSGDDYDELENYLKDNNQQDENLIDPLEADDADTIDLDIRSIMANNDKLVNRLLSTLLSSSSNDNNDNNNNNTNSRDHGQNHVDRASSNSNSYSDNNGKSEEGLDYDLSLLVELVSKTIEDYNKSIPSDNGELYNTILGSLASSFSTEDDNSNRRLAKNNNNNNKPRPPPNELELAMASSVNQSENRIDSDSDNDNENDDYDFDFDRRIGKNKDINRARRESSSITDGHATNNWQAATSPSSFDHLSSVALMSQCKEEEEELAKIVRLERRKMLSEAGVAVSDEESNSNDKMKFYRNCQELPSECEWGGKCLVEEFEMIDFDHSLVNYNNQNFDYSFKGLSNNSPKSSERLGKRIIKFARCQCPIGRGGTMCQKHEMGRVELRYLTGTTTLDNNNNYDFVKEKFSKEVTRVIGSRDVEFNKWNELIITDASVDYLINNEQEKKSSSSKTASNNNNILNKIILVTPEKINTSSNENGELFLGGVPKIRNNIDNMTIKSKIKSNDYDNKLLGMKSFNYGFDGCIREFSINDRVYNLKSDFNGDILDGFDIEECCR